MLAQIVKLQDQMELLIGLAIKEAGAKLPDSPPVDLISAIWRMKIAKRTLPMLLRKEMKLRKKFSAKSRLPEQVSFQTNTDIQVY